MPPSPPPRGKHSYVFGMSSFKIIPIDMNVFTVLIYFTFLIWVIEVRGEGKKKEFDRCFNASFNRHTFVAIVKAAPFQKD